MGRWLFPVPMTDAINTRLRVPLSRFLWPDEKLALHAERTFRLQLNSAMCEGLFHGVIGLSGVVLKKSLAATDGEVAMAQTLGTVPMLAAFFWVQFLAYMDHSSYIRSVGILSRIGLVAMAFVTTPTPLLMLLFTVAVGGAATLPALNRIMQTNYSSSQRGTLFAYSSVRQNFVILLTSMSMAWVLDQDPSLYRVIFPVMGLVGLAGPLIMSRMEVRAARQSEGLLGAARRLGAVQMGRELFVRPLAVMWAFARNEPVFVVFQCIFFLYGCGFMSSWPLVTILITDELNLSYFHASVLTVVIPVAGSLLLSLAVGRVYDRLNPLITMAGSCVLLMTYTLLMANAYSSNMVLIGMCFYAAGMVGVNLSWSLCGMYFAGDRAVEPYMALHLVFAGLRGLIAPWFGVWLSRYTGLHAAFYLSAGFFLCCLSGMLVMNRYLRKKRMLEWARVRRPASEVVNKETVA